ncbi:hypothetical protein [Georgenia deserti]|uniref:Glycosyltransferase RgtA/B/C/D-like domain-containing protein n=1 Tax=Georgenia deserti TaxID=2093781 RepID=A0ABW4L8D3_9MICO
MRRMVRTIVVLFLGATVLVGAPSGRAHADNGDTLALPGASTLGPDERATIDVPVPQGVTPAELLTSVSLDGPLLPAQEGDEFVMMVAGREAARLPLARVAHDGGTDVAVQVERRDITTADDGRRTVPVDLTVRRRAAGTRDAGETTGRRCLTDAAAVTVTDLRLRAAGTETVPTHPADFFPQYSPSVDVLIDADASDRVLESALSAAASLVTRYPDPSTTIRLTTEAERSPDGLGVRAVHLREAAAPVPERVEVEDGVPTLVLTGPLEDLERSVTALGSPDPAGTSLASAPTSATLADLGAPAMQLLTPSRMESGFTLRQDAFGGPVHDARLHLEARHTALPRDLRARLEVRLDGETVHREVLDPDDTEVSADVGLPDLSASSRLTLVLTAPTAAERCDLLTREVPVAVDVDPAASRIDVTRGPGGTDGFAMFPQALTGTLPVAVGDGAEDRLAALRDASYLVAALQREATRPLAVELVASEQILDGGSGLLVGADNTDARTLVSPLRYSSMHLRDFWEEDYPIGSGNRFAALQAFGRGDDQGAVVLLGGWDPTDAYPADLTRAAAAAAQERGWSQLVDNLFLATDSVAPFSMSDEGVIPQAERTDEAGRIIWWFAGGLGVLLVLLVLRRRRGSELSPDRDDNGHIGDEDRIRYEEEHGASRPRRRGLSGLLVALAAPPAGRRVPGSVWMFLLGVLVSAAAAVYTVGTGSNMDYGDSMAHLTIAARILDGQNPGLQQLGTVWLPLPHLLLLPFVQSMWLFETGIAAAILGALCLGVATCATFRIAARLGFGLAGRMVAVLVTLANPSLLYASTTALTEPVLIAAITACIAGLAGWTFSRRKLSGGELAVFAGIPAAAGVLTRYEGWALVVSGAVFVMFVVIRRGDGLPRALVLALSFAAVPAGAAAWWLAYNMSWYGDPLEFLTGDYSAAAFTEVFGDQLTTDGNLGLSAKVLGWAIVENVGLVPVLLAGVGLALMTWRWGIDNRALVIWLAGTSTAFLLVSLVGGQHIMTNDMSMPQGAYNNRYALSAIPWAALLSAYLAHQVVRTTGKRHGHRSGGDRRFTAASAAAVGIVVLALAGQNLWWAGDPGTRMSVIEEAEIGHRSALDAKASARWLNAHYDGGGLLMDEGSEALSVTPLLGIPLDEIDNRAAGEHFTAALERPSAHVRWVLMHLEQTQGGTAGSIDLVNDALAEDLSFHAAYELVHQQGNFGVYRRIE